MRILLAIAFASVYALCIRLMFGVFHGVMEIMSTTFLMMTPVIIGMITIVLIPAAKVPSRVSAFFLPWLSAIVILIITILFNIEGTICWIMVFPLFAILTGFGGILVYEVRIWKKKKSSNKKSQKQNTINISLAIFIPIALGYLEGERSLTPEIITIQEQIVISSSPSEVWKQILAVKNLKHKSETTTMSQILGFPKHLKTTLDTAAVGGKRIAYYEKGLFFEEVITKYDNEKKLVLKLEIDPNKIPATVMDEHILIGGKYLDILEDTYELKKLRNGNTKLTLSSQFYINTPFNWYSKAWAKYLLSEVLNGELKKIKSNSLINKS